MHPYVVYPRTIGVIFIYIVHNLMASYNLMASHASRLPARFDIKRSQSLPILSTAATGCTVRPTACTKVSPSTAYR